MKDLINNFIFSYYINLIEELTTFPTFRSFKKLKTHLLKKLDFTNFLNALITILMGVFFFKAMNRWTLDISFYRQMMMTAGSSLVFCGGWMMISDLSNGDLKQWFMLQLHEIWFNKEQRSEVILWRYQNLRQEQKEIEDKLSYWERGIKHDIKKFCDENFGVCTSSFINFYQSKILMGGEVYEEFLNYSLSIPKRKELGSERLRKILLSFKPLSVVITDKIYHNITASFDNYTLEQIEKIFTSPHGHDYWSSLVEEMIDMDYPRAYRIYDSFYEMRFDEERILYIPSHWWNLNNKKIKSYEFSLLLTRKDYSQASDDFSNCLRTYSEKWGSVIFRVKKSGKDYACVEICQDEIREIRGVKNKEIKDSELLKIIADFKP